MQATVFCRTVEKGIQSFFVRINGKDYFLFRQGFRKSNKEFFQNGVSVHSINNYAGIHSTAVRMTLDKLPSHIRYIEKEYEVAIYEKTKKKQQQKKQKSYKREPFRWQDFEWEVS